MKTATEHPISLDRSSIGQSPPGELGREILRMAPAGALIVVELWWLFQHRSSMTSAEKIVLIETAACWTTITVAFWLSRGPWAKMLQLGLLFSVLFWALAGSQPRAGLLVSAIWNGCFLLRLTFAVSRRMWLR